MEKEIFKKTIIGMTGQQYATLL